MADVDDRVGGAQIDGHVAATVGRQVAREAYCLLDSITSARPHDDQLVDPGFGPQTSPGRPRSWRTFAGELFSLIGMNRFERGLKRTIAFAPKSVTQTKSRPST